jgi:hypothetical protein
MSLTRIRGGDGQISALAWQQQVYCIGTTKTDIPTVGTALATGLTGSQDVGGTIVKYWADIQKVDRESFPGRLFIAGVASAPKAYTE